jgi:Spx/MgsR family transcriptional regulator
MLAPMIIVHGISNCDTVKKARAWLDAQGIAYRFHDVRKDGLDAATLAQWVDALGWENVLNRAGTTFRQLDAADRADMDADKAVALMLAAPAMMKRPLVTGAGAPFVGFKPDVWAAKFAAK